MAIPMEHDGVDYLNTTYAVKRGWVFNPGSSSICDIQAGVGRDGGRAARLDGDTFGSDPELRKTFTPVTTGTLVWAIYLLALPSGNPGLISLREGSTVHLQIRISTAGVVSLYRGGTLLQDNIATITATTWLTFQFSFTIHDSTGAWSLSIDGVAKGSASGIDTRDGGLTGAVDNLSFQRTAFGSLFRVLVDDISIYNSVVTHEDFRSEALMPTADGAHAAWTLSTGSDGYALVDEVPPSLTDFLNTSGVGNKVSFSYPAPSTAGDIRCLTWRPLLRAAVAGVRQVRAFLRIGGVDYPHATTVTLGSDDAFGGWSWDENPATTVAFDAADFPLEVGLEVMV